MYHYTISGLDNVWLKNGYEIKETRYGPAVSIHDADQLDKAIAEHLLSKKGPLNGQELRFLRTLLGLSQEGLGNMVGVKEQTVSLWERKRQHEAVPTHADAFVRMLYSEKVDGNLKITAAIERINAVERMCNQRVVVKEGRGGWKAKIDPNHDHPPLLEAA